MNKYSTMLASVAAAGFILTAASHSADAATAKSQTFVGELNQLSDNSAERLFADLDSDGNLDIGDSLRGIFSIGTIENLSGGGSNVLGIGGVNELTGIFEAEVISKTSVGGGLFDYAFGPSAAFAAEFSLVAGALVAWFEDSTPDFNRNTTTAAGEASATDGTLVATTGFGIDGDELWVALGAPERPSDAQGAAAGSSLGQFNIQMSVLDGTFFANINQVAALVNLDDGLIDINASGNILGTLGINTGFEVFDNVDFVFAPISPVPEPATIGLLGAGLIGLGATALRRRRLAKKAS